MTTTAFSQTNLDDDRSIEVSLTYEEVPHLATAMATMRGSPTITLSFASWEATAILFALKSRDYWNQEDHYSQVHCTRPPRLTKHKLEDIETRLRKSTWSTVPFTSNEIKWFHAALLLSRAATEEFFACDDVEYHGAQLCSFLAGLEEFDAGEELYEILNCARDITA
jgi:hypothetical protein